MASKSENAEIAVLQTQMTGVEQTVTRIESKIDTLGQSYVTVNDFTMLKSDFIAFKKQYWLSHTLTALLTAAIISLIYYFVNGGAAKHVGG